MKYLIAGLGNIGEEYLGTRHNVGFRIVNEIAECGNTQFEDSRYGAVARLRVKNVELVLLKPSTFMNLSGLAVRYWLKKESLPVSQLLVAVDDLSLPFGTLRMKPKGSHGGHNGLRNIEENLATEEFARLRFGIGNNFQRGGQVDYVLSGFTDEELEKMPERIKLAADMVRTFCLSGIELTMNMYNKKG